jgi:DNA-binding response OmpR family regulator
MEPSIDDAISSRARVAREPAPTGLVLVAAFDVSVGDALRRAGHDVASVSDGESLVRTLEDPELGATIDVVVAELALPRRSALEVLAALRGRPTPAFVLLSPFGSRALYEEARRAGAFVMLREPVLAAHLNAVVSTLVRRAFAAK